MKGYKWFQGARDAEITGIFENFYAVDIHEDASCFELGKEYTNTQPSEPHGRGYYGFPTQEDAEAYADSMMEQGYDDWDYGTTYLVELEVDDWVACPQDEWDSEAPEYVCQHMKLVKICE